MGSSTVQVGFDITARFEYLKKKRKKKEKKRKKLMLLSRLVAGRNTYIFKLAVNILRNAGDTLKHKYV